MSRQVGSVSYVYRPEDMMWFMGGRWRWTPFFNKAKAYRCSGDAARAMSFHGMNKTKHRILTGFFDLEVPDGQP